MNAYDRVTLTLRMMATLALLVLVVFMAWRFAEATAPPVNEFQPAPAYTNPRWQDAPDIRLVPCATEGSSNCYWDASLRGNTYGQSFVNIDGVIYYKP